MNIKIGPPVTIVVGDILFVKELLGDFIESDAQILKSINGGANIEVFMSKHTNLALRLNNTLVITRLTISSDPVGVPTLPGYMMLLPANMILVILGSDF